VWFVLVDVATDDGPSGLAYLWTFSDHGARAVQHVIAELAEVAIGEDPFFTTRLWRRMWARITQWGHKGLSLIGMAGIDIAVWDIVSRAFGQPLAHVLGANADPVRTYASEGLWLTDDLPALAREADEILGQGFRAIKMRLGRARMADDLEAVRIVRETIGPDVTLMVDSNQGWDVDYTIRIGRKLGRVGQCHVTPCVGGSARPEPMIRTDPNSTGTSAASAMIRFRRWARPL